jgi:hypothetical protein
MTNVPKAPILLHAIDALRRARKLPAGAARNDLRYRAGAYAHLQSNHSPLPGSESMR